MKNLTLILLLAFTLGCKKDATDPTPTPIAGKKLTSVTRENRPYMTFEYQKDLLVKENYYMMCETNPADEFVYEYSGGTLSKLKTTMRSIYSSLAALCNPDGGMKLEETFTYNSKGQLTKVVRNDNTTEFVYNTKGLVEKQTISGGETPRISTFEYDSRGNLIKENNFYGGTTYYTYDDKINPYYTINQRPQWISPFNKSPNNVLKATGSYTFERSYKYDADGYPAEVTEDNKFVYKYSY